MSRLEIKQEDKELIVSSDEEPVTNIIFNGMDDTLTEDLLTIHKHFEEVDVFAMVTKMLEEFVKSFRDKQTDNRVHLRKCQFLAGDYRGESMNPKNALPMQYDDQQMVDAFLIQENTGYSILYIPCMKNKRDRFWYVGSEKVHNITTI